MSDLKKLSKCSDLYFLSHYGSWIGSCRPRRPLLRCWCWCPCSSWWCCRQSSEGSRLYCVGIGITVILRNLVCLQFFRYRRKYVFLFVWMLHLHSFILRTTCMVCNSTFPLNLRKSLLSVLWPRAGVAGCKASSSKQRWKIWKFHCSSAVCNYRCPSFH